MPHWCGDGCRGGRRKVRGLLSSATFDQVERLQPCTLSQPHLLTRGRQARVVGGRRSQELVSKEFSGKRGLNKYEFWKVIFTSIPMKFFSNSYRKCANPKDIMILEKRNLIAT
jgi:hypothetical protein